MTGLIELCLRRKSVIRTAAGFVAPAVEALEERCMLDTALLAGTNVNVSHLPNVQAETTIAVNPLNAQQLFTSSVSYGGNSGLFAANSTDGGTTWNGRIIAGGDSLPAAYADPQAAFDQFGNLFLVYLTSGPLHADMSTG